MYEAKDLTRKAEQLRKAGDLEAAGMIERLNQLLHSYIPQLHKKMESVGFSWWTKEKFPHMIKYTKPAEPCKHNDNV